MQPAENRSEVEALPRFKRDPLAFKLFAFDVRAELDIAADLFCRALVKAIRELGIIVRLPFEIMELPLTGKLYPFASRDFPGENGVAISESNGDIIPRSY